MSLRCAVCGRPGARAERTIGGVFYGNACTAEGGQCLGLLWEAHFVKATGGSQYEHECILWHWRKRRAEAEGIIFLAPFPTDPRDVASERLARELQARPDLPQGAA